MNIGPYFTRILVYSLVNIILLSTTACLKRVPVQVNDQQEVIAHDVVYVRLNSGIEYRIEDARFEGEYLIGTTKNREIEIPISNIEAVEVLRQDIKKIFIGHAVVLLTMISFVFLFLPRGITFD